MRRAMGRSRREDGFTLMEVLAALTVFLVGIVGVVSLFTSGTILHQSSQKLAVTTDIIEQLFLQIENELPAHYSASGSEQNSVEQGLRPVPGREGYSFAYSITQADDALSYRVEVVIVWKEGGQERTHAAHAVFPGVRTFGQEVRRMRRRPPKKLETD